MNLIDFHNYYIIFLKLNSFQNILWDSARDIKLNLVQANVFNYKNRSEKHLIQLQISPKNNPLFNTKYQLFILSGEFFVYVIYFIDL